MKSARPVSFRRYFTLIELFSLMGTAVFLFLLGQFAISGIEKSYFTSRREDISKVRTVLTEYLLSAEAEFLRISRIPEDMKSGPIMDMATHFSDFYRLDEDMVVEQIHKQTEKSRIFREYSFAWSSVGKFFLSRPAGQVSFSPLTRGAEDETPSIYVGIRQENHWELGRIDLSFAFRLFHQLSAFSGTPLLFLSSSGFVIYSTNPELQLYTIPIPDIPLEEGLRLPPLSTAHVDWIPYIATGGVENTILALLIPTKTNRAAKLTIYLFSLIFLLLLLFITVIKRSRIEKRLLSPLFQFQELLNKYGEKHISVTEEITVPRFRELQDLFQRFKGLTDTIGKRENELVESERKFRNLLELLPVAIRISETDGKVLMNNDAFINLFGYSSDEIPTIEHWFSLAYPDPAYRKEVYSHWMLTLAQAWTTNEASKPEIFSITCKDGTVKEVEIFMRPLGDLSVTIFHDLTEKISREKKHKHLQDQLYHSQKMDAVGQLAGGVAHDFNNMLAGIMGVTQLLLSGENLTDQQKEYCELILSTSERAGDLTGKLLTFAQKGKGTSTPVDMVKIVEDSVAMLRRTVDKNIRISVNVYDSTLVVVGDDAQLQNICLNLGINAWHAMPDGGDLSFELSVLRLDSTVCQTMPFKLSPGNYVSLEVRDTGTGIPPEVQKHVFEPFFTTKEQGKGTGLGLAAVYGAVQDHHGAVSLYSEPGEGTVFHLYFPLAEIEREPAHPEQILPRGSGTILLADDEDLIRTTAKVMLESLGYRVITARNGQEALDIFSNQGPEVDLVILDMIMPVLGGRKTFALLREMAPACPVLISSGFSKAEDLEDLRVQGQCEFIRKPYRLAELSETIHRVLRNQD